MRQKLIARLRLVCNELSNSPSAPSSGKHKNSEAKTKGRVSKERKDSEVQGIQDNVTDSSMAHKKRKHDLELL